MGKFEDYVNNISNSKSGTINVPNNVKLDFYKFYKQATIGNCNTDKPSFYRFEDTAKWEAWNSILGMSKEDAKTNYIDLYETVMRTT